MKYKHGNYDKDIIFNDLYVDWSKPIILVEGPYDAIKAGSNAVAIQSNHLPVDSKLFTKLIFSHQPIYIALDSDAMKNTFKIAKDLVDYGVDVNVITMGEHKDPGDMTKDQFKKRLELSEKFDSNTMFKFAIKNDIRIRV
jgi:hypothetical protein